MHLRAYGENLHLKAFAGCGAQGVGVRLDELGEVGVVGSAEAVVAAEGYDADASQLAGLGQRRGELGVGTEQVGDDTPDAAAEWHEPAQSLFGLAHLGGGDHLHGSGDFLRGGHGADSSFEFS